MIGRHPIASRIAIVAGVLFACAAATQARDVDVTRLWTLSDFNGPILFNGGRIEIDPRHDEAIWLTSGRARVFNAAGMEVFTFEMPVSGVVDLANLPGTDMLVLTAGSELDDSAFGLTRIDFRGRLRSTIEIGAFPAEFANFEPDRLEVEGDRLYLVDSTLSQVVILDENGSFLRGIDLTQYVDNSENVRGEPELGGFAVAADGTIAFTVPMVDGAYMITPDGEIRRWGKGGSNPGSFGIVGAIAIDDQHRTYVIDVLRRVILCFDENQVFVDEFTGRDRSGRDGLVSPKEIVVDPRGRLYVSQMGMQGAAVFAANWE